MHGPQPSPRDYPKARRLVWLACLLALAGCAVPPPVVAPQETAVGPVLAGDERFLVLTVRAGDTLGSLAGAYLGDAGEGWRIAQFNAVDRIVAGQSLVIPLVETNPTGVGVDGYRTVTILTYHRIDERSLGRMSVATAEFGRQMAYLAANGYHVIELSLLEAFLRGARSLPRNAVVITFDDGYRSAYLAAFPILRRYGFPATLFVYSNYVGQGGLTWAQLNEMKASGLISVQAHSMAHTHLASRLDGENEAGYRQRLTQEIASPAELLERQLGSRPFSFAYPYGDANEEVTGQLRAQGYTLGLTVIAGGNPAFADPFLLRRTMVYGDDDMAAFRGKLQTFHSVDLR